MIYAKFWRKCNSQSQKIKSHFKVLLKTLFSLHRLISLPLQLVAASMDPDHLVQEAAFLQYEVATHLPSLQPLVQGDLHRLA